MHGNDVVRINLLYIIRHPSPRDCELAHPETYLQATAGPQRHFSLVKVAMGAASQSVRHHLACRLGRDNPSFQRVMNPIAAIAYLMSLRPK
jgi:hypothetical protein